MSELHRVETVRVVSPVSQDNPHGYIVINKSDLAASHKIFIEPSAKPAPKPAVKRDVFIDGKE